MHRAVQDGQRNLNHQTEVEMVLDTHRHWPYGIQMAVRRLRRAGCSIRYACVYAILKPHGLVTDYRAKSGQRTWGRYERLYSNAMWHTDGTP